MRNGIKIATLMLGLLAVQLPASAAFQNVPSFLNAPHLGIVVFKNADGLGANKIVYTAGANGSKCVAAWGTNSDTANTYTMYLNVTRAAVVNQINGTILPILAGYSSPPATMWPTPGNSFLPIDSDGAPYLYLNSGDVVAVVNGQTVSGVQTVTIFVLCADF